MRSFVRARSISVLVGSVFLGAALGADEPETLQVELESGARVIGKQIQRRPDRLVIDLGFSVLTIPTDAIQRIVR
jgi:hypothetical protein